MTFFPKALSAAESEDKRRPSMGVQFLCDQLDSHPRWRLCREARKTRVLAQLRVPFLWSGKPKGRSTILGSPIPVVLFCFEENQKGKGIVPLPLTSFTQTAIRQAFQPWEDCDLQTARNGHQPLPVLFFAMASHLPVYGHRCPFWLFWWRIDGPGCFIIYQGHLFSQKDIYAFGCFLK